MYLRVLFVHADQQFVREMLIDIDDMYLYILERRQVARLLRFQVGRVQTPVLIACLILNIEDMPVIFGPEVETDAAIRVIRDRLVIILANGSYPDIQNIIH